MPALGKTMRESQAELKTVLLMFLPYFYTRFQLSQPICQICNRVSLHTLMKILILCAQRWLINY